jgi:hypothetical protein
MPAERPLTPYPKGRISHVKDQWPIDRQHGRQRSRMFEVATGRAYLGTRA